MRSADFIDTIYGQFTSPSPMDILSVSELSLAETERGMGKRARKAGDKTDSGSFIDLSDDDNHPMRVLSPNSFPSPPHPCPSDSQDVMLQPRSPDEDRRRKREKIAKLHRFLGSRVPTSLVLGLSSADDALDPSVVKVDTHHSGRRRSSSAAEFKTKWFDPDDRLKEELGEREKAINVRRAVKMEKVIYHNASFPKSFS